MLRREITYSAIDSRSALVRWTKRGIAPPVMIPVAMVWAMASTAVPFLKALASRKSRGGGLSVFPTGPSPQPLGPWQLPHPFAR